MRLDGDSVYERAGDRNQRAPVYQWPQASLGRTGILSERTAAMVWQYLCGCTVLPGCWNAFPFHPHWVGNPNSNRPPSALEIGSAAQFIQMILRILQPHTVIAVGRAAMKAMEYLPTRIPVVYVRHPSFGGKRSFIRGMTEAGVA